MDISNIRAENIKFLEKIGENILILNLFNRTLKTKL